MTLKKKIEIAAILCSIGICSFGQNVFAGEFLRLPAQTNAKVEQVVQTRLLEEQRAYLMQAQLMTKVNLEQQIKDKPVYIPKTKHVVTQRERSILERIVEAEATDKDEKSKILVANVILNRVRSKEFPNSIEAVVFQRAYGKVQFSPTADGRYESVHITKSTKRSVKKCIRRRNRLFRRSIIFRRKNRWQILKMFHGLMRHLPDCLPIKDILFTNNA